MTTPRRHTARFARAAVGALLVTMIFAGSASAAVFSVFGGLSDNYKASFNSNPQLRELRTWLSMDSIAAAGTTWAPVAPGAITFTSPLTVVSADGRGGVLSVTSSSANIASVFLRADPPTDKVGVRWGPLVTLKAPMGRGNAKARIGLTLSTGGATIATGVLDYWATTFAGAGASIERNGPSGRWRVEGFPLDTDWQTGSMPSRALPATVPLAPRVTALLAAASTNSARRIRVRARAAQGAAVLLARYRLGSGAYTSWQRASTVFSFRLRPGSRAKVSVEVRDVRGFISRPFVRLVS